MKVESSFHVEVHRTVYELHIWLEYFKLLPQAIAVNTFFFFPSKFLCSVISGRGLSPTHCYIFRPSATLICSGDAPSEVL